MELLHRYTLGDAPISFEILSDYEVNYDDPNMNVAIPVFSIHGNHDDPSGKKSSYWLKNHINIFHILLLEAIDCKIFVFHSGRSWRFKFNGCAINIEAIELLWKM